MATGAADTMSQAQIPYGYVVSRARLDSARNVDELARLLGVSDWRAPSKNVDAGAHATSSTPPASPIGSIRPKSGAAPRTAAEDARS